MDKTAETYPMTPYLRRRLLQFTIEMMALPQLICTAGECHRRSRCDCVSKKDKSPWCLQFLFSEERAGFNALLGIAEELLRRLLLGSFWVRWADDAATLELQLAACEIVDAMVESDIPRTMAFRPWWRSQRVLARPRGLQSLPIDIGQFPPEQIVPRRN